MISKEKMTPEQRERLQKFKADIPQQLEKFFQLAKESEKYQQIKPEYDYRTLQLVEDFYFDLMNRVESSEYSQAQLNELFGVYLGEAALFHRKGEWIIDPFEDSMHFDKPVIAFHKGDLLLFNPSSYLNNMIYHNKRNCIVKSINSIKYHEEIQRQRLEEMENLGKRKKGRK